MKLKRSSEICFFCSFSNFLLNENFFLPHPSSIKRCVLQLIFEQLSLFFFLKGIKLQDNFLRTKKKKKK